MFIVEINSNQLMNAGQIPMNRRDHVGVALDRGTLGPKLEVEVTSQLTQSVERIRWRKHSKVLIDSLVPAASKSTKHSPESLSISSLGCHRHRSRIRPPFRYFYEKNLGEKRLYSKIFQWPTACFQQLRHEPDVVNIIDSVTQG